MKMQAAAIDGPGSAGSNAIAVTSTGRLMMEKWEYYIFTSDLHKLTMFKKGEKTAQDYLNELGRDGWELVNAIKTLSNALLSDEYTFFLKRKLD